MIDLGNNYAVRQFIGMFFEELAERIFEAKMIPRRNFREGDIHPDLECSKLDAWLEIKATQSIRPFKIYLSQIDKYKKLLADAFPYSRIFYVFFSHQVFNISRDYTDPETLGQDLVLNTIQVLVLDFPVVLAICQKLEVATEYAYSGFPPFYKWDHRINTELADWTEGSMNYLDLDTKRYRIKKAQIDLPYGGIKCVPTLSIISAKK